METSNQSGQSKLPKQSVPIQRPSTSVSIQSEQGIEASGMFDIFKLFR